MIRLNQGTPVEIVGLKLPERSTACAVLVVRLAGDVSGDTFPYSVADLQARDPHEIERELIAACGRNLRGQIVIGDAAFQALRGRLANLRRAGQAAWDKSTTGGLTANASAVVALADITGCLDLLGLYVAELRHETASLRLENERLRDAVRMPKTTTNVAAESILGRQL